MEELLQKFVASLNTKLIHPEKDTDLLIEELEELGVFFNGEFWYYDSN